MSDAGRAASLAMTNMEDIGPHYAVTLREWRSAWEAHKERVLELGYSERFWRKYRLAAVFQIHPVLESERRTQDGVQQIWCLVKKRRMPATGFILHTAKQHLLRATFTTGKSPGSRLALSAELQPRTVLTREMSQQCQAACLTLPILSLRCF